MRGLRGTSVAAVGVCALLAAGGGYALASGSSGKTITVCVSRHGGALYKAKKCAKHDKKLSWNKVGRQGIQGIQGQTGMTGQAGPGATYFFHNWAGAASPAREALGTIGPWTFTGLCTSSGGNTGLEIDFTGPGIEGDGVNASDTGASAVIFTLPGPLTSQDLGDLPPVSTHSTEASDQLLVPTSGSPVLLHLTAAVYGMSPPAGFAANTCHVSYVITPVSAASASTAAAKATSGSSGGGLFGK